MDPANALIIGGAAVAAIAVTAKDNAEAGPVPGHGALASKAVPIGKATISKPSTVKVASTPSGKAFGSTATKTVTSQIKNAMSIASSGTWRQSTTSHPKEVTDELEKKATSEFAKLSGAAKTEACKRLKTQFPNSPGVQALNCGAPVFQQMLVAVAGAAGPADSGPRSGARAGRGTAYCGPLCGALAGWAAATFGPKVQEWVEGAYDNVKEWAGDAWDAGTDAVSDAWDAVW